MRGFGIFKVIGKSLYKVGKIAVVGTAATLVTHGPETLQALSAVNPWAALAFTILYSGLDAYKHRDKAE